MGWRGFFGDGLCMSILMPAGGTLPPFEQLFPVTELCCLAEGSAPTAYGRKGLRLSIVLKTFEFVQAPSEGGEGSRGAQATWVGYGPRG